MKNSLVLVIIILLGFIFYGVFSQINKASSKNLKRVPCQNKTTTFEKINTEANIIEAIKLLENGSYKIEGYIDYSKFMKSNIKEIISEEEIKNRITKVIKAYKKSNLTFDKNLNIKFYIYENDREDKRKKGDSCKIYSGYIVLEFILDKKTVYKIQTDYMKDDMSDLNERIDCAIKSILSLKN
ncbi:hypothetical protein ACH5BF_06215 [Arcobacter sp. YIC-464]|uniref:hypothetical protein n=1 Tax=Arcobacter sp. YIC-464 TaxID=3376631 RepID=UPI003C185057